MKVDIRKLEQFLKRNLKRKVSMSVGTVICYLLTGGFAFGQDYIEVTENKVISENEIISESLKIVGEGLTITNNGVVDVFYEENNIAADINLKGNGVFSENINNIQGIKNNGIISGEINLSNNEIDAYVGASLNGNGINISKSYMIPESYNQEAEALIIEEIKNTGTISGNLQFLNGNSYYSGNGININNEMYLDKTTIGKILNNGVIVGSAELINSNTETNYYRGLDYNGNGISINSFNIEISDIENNGSIFGMVKSTTDISNEFNSGFISLSGNGVVISSFGNRRVIENMQSIGNVLNNGVIFGESINFFNQENESFKDIYSSGNGILINSYNGILNSIINKGVIIGRNTFNGSGQNNLEVYSYLSGNGIYLGGVDFKKIENNGIISGKTTVENDLIAGASVNGNGLYISRGKLVKNRELENTLIGKIYNDGLISGQNNSTQQITRTSNGLINGNGIVVEGHNLELQGILNNGVISGYSNIIRDALKINGYSESGNGIYIADTYGSSLGRVTLESTVVKNYGVIKGSNKGIQSLNGNILVDNYGVIAGSVESDNINENKGVLLEIDAVGNVVQSEVAESTSIDGKNIINGTTTGVINNTTGTISGDIYVDASNLSTKENLIINGTGTTTGALNVNEDVSLEGSIINGYNTAVYVNSGKSFTGNNVTFNGGGLYNDIPVIKGDSGDNKVEILGNSIINGDVDLGAGADSLLVSNGTQINGDLFGGEGIDSLQLGNGIHNESHPLNNYDSNGDGAIDKGDWRGLAIYNSISEFENINVGGVVTLYETAKINGDTNIHIGAGGSLNLRIDPTKKDFAGRVIGHALYSEGNKTITTEKHELGANIEEYWQNGDKGNFLKGGTLNIITNGLGIGGVIAMSEIPMTRDTTNIGSTVLDPSKQNLYVKTDSIIHSATVYKEGDVASYAATQAQVGDIKVTVNPDILVVPPNPDPPIKPPVYSGPRYNQLNRIYKSLIANGDNINAIYPTTSITLLSEYLNYPVQSESTITDMALGNLLTLLNEIYTASPYSFSNELSRESMELYSDVIIDNPFKARDKEWMIYGGLLHESVDLKDRYYAKNYHGFDTLDKTSSIKADNKITGAYALGEYGINSSLSVGGILGGSKNKSDISNGSDLDGNAFYIGSYFKKDIENLRILGGIGYQYTDYDAKRKASNMMQSFSYDNSYEDNGLNIYLSGKYNYPLGDNYYLVPKVKLAYTYIDQDGVNEGGNPLAMDIDSKKFNVFDGTIGVDLKKELFHGEGKSSVRVGVSYKRLLNGSDDEYLTARMRDGSDFDLLIPNKVKNNYSVEVGYEYESQRGILFNLNGSYSFDVSESNTVRDNSKTKNSEKGWIIGVGVGYRFK